jgi:ABC-type nitrate/sulfonate/bicarbonate transport system substrate-binding protein
MRLLAKRHIAAIVALACCISIFGTAPSATAQDKIRIVFPTTPTTLFLAYYVAQKKGWLKELAIEETYVTGDSNAIRAVLSDHADFGGGVGTFSVLSAVEAGADIKAIGSWSPLPDYNVVIAQGKGSTIADLAGKIIATSGPGALPEQLPRILMRKHHVDPSTSRFIQVGGHPARLQAVLVGRADATLVNTVTALDAIESGKVKVVAKIANEFPMLGYVWNVARVSTLNDPKKAAALQALTTAGIKGARFIMQYPDEAAAILNERVPTLDLALCKRVIKDLNRDKVWGVDGGLDPRIIDFTAKTGNELGLLKREVPASKIASDQFVAVAEKDLAQK